MVNPEKSPANLPNLDGAILEYFADVAFDDRLDILLAKGEFSQKTFTAFTSSQYDVYPPFLVHNYRDVTYEKDIEEAERFTWLNVNGRLIKDKGVNHLSLEFISDTDTTNRLKILSNAYGTFDIYQPDNPNIQSINLYDVTRLSLLANDVDPAALDKIADLENPEEEYRKILNFVWNRAAELSGVNKDVSTLELRSSDYTDEKPVLHRLIQTQYSQSVVATNRQTNAETEPEDFIHISYEHVTKHIQLEAEEVYRIDLHYRMSGESLTKDAQKIVRSKLLNLSDVTITQTATDGTTRKLDTNDPQVMEMFVNSFEELLAAA